jgi:class 3 adenylate cyclase
MIDTLETGRDAVARHAWAEATEAFAAADRDTSVLPDDLELWAQAAWWLGDIESATETLERAFASYEAAGRPADAARVALQLAYQGFRRLFPSVGAGWLARAERILESEDESSVLATVRVYHALDAVLAGRIDEGIGLADEAIELARKYGNADALYLALSFQGLGEVYSGNHQTGLALIDEAAAAASSGRLGLRVASDIYCNTIAACRSIGDLARAGQWADEGERWMRRQSVGGYPGVCQVHRAELKMLHGHWSEAEQEARHACQELEHFGLIDAAGHAHYQVGEIRLRMGDLDGAAEAFERAYEYGSPAQPGLALLALARGELDEATRSIARALASAAGTGGTVDESTRARLLPAQVDIALGAGDLELAGQAVTELESIAAHFGRPMFEAGALMARGELLLGEERPADASPLLDRSWRMWLATELPYESARARLRYAEALAAEGDVATARRDLRAARSVFERLGATLDIQRIDALLGEAQATSTLPAQRVTKTFMFTDIVTSTDLIGLIGDEAWGELLQWHDRELRATFAQHQGEEVNHTGDGFLVAFERASDAVECAVDIQRRLTRHRHDHGFAPVVRIGLHAAEATRRGRAYSGRGVHVAARIGAAAAGGEILISEEAFERSKPSRFTASEARSLKLKGVDELVEVRAIGWR